MRSVVVVLPASTCAMIPMFRVRASGTLRVSWARTEGLMAACSGGTKRRGAKRLGRGPRACARGGRSDRARWFEHSAATGHRGRRGIRRDRGPPFKPREFVCRVLASAPPSRWSFCLRLRRRRLPAVVRERLVRVGHLVDVLALL